MNLYTDEILEAYGRWQGIQSSPSKESLKRPNGMPIFRNHFIEYRIARAHPLVPFFWVIPVSTLLFLKGLEYRPFTQSLGLLVVGFLSWTLIEYVIHMFLFHKKITPTTPPRIKFLVFMLHGYHHEFPNDPTRLVMPIILAWPLGTLLGFCFWLILGSSLFFAFYGGLLLGYLAYDAVHYYEHYVQPTSALGKFMRKFHAIHHFMDENKNFGISTPIWDKVFMKFKAP